MTKNKFYWYLTACISLLIFTGVASLVAFNDNLLATIDQPIIQLVRGTITSSKTLFFSTMTRFGDTLTVILLTGGLAAILFFYFKEKIAALWLVINSALIQGAGNTILKLLFNRPRPSGEHLVYAGGTSFPSGHSMGSMLLYGTLILLLPKFIKNKSVCLVLQVLLGLIILSVGTSRIYLGVHYPTDIIGGFSMGLCWLSFSYPHFKKYDALTH